MFLSILSPPLPPTLHEALVQGMAGLEGAWEWLVVDAGVPSDRWREGCGTWLIFLDASGHLPNPQVWSEAEDFDVLGLPPDGPLRPPFALRRTLLEAVGGLHDLPEPLLWTDLTLRLQGIGARCQAWPMPSAPPERPPTRTDLLALFSRHPHRKTLQWALGQTSSDPDLLEEAHRAACGHSVPAQCRLSSQDLGVYFAEQACPPLQSAGVLQAALDALADAGAWVSGAGREALFDKCHAMNMLLSQSPLKQAGLRRNPLLRFPPPSMAGCADPVPLGIEVEGVYTVALEQGLQEESRGGTLILPLPAETTHQTLAFLEPFYPPEVGMELLPETGHLRFTLPQTDLQPLRMGYRFRAQVREGGLAPGTAPSVTPPSPVARSFREPLNAMLRAIFPDTPPSSPLARAQRIYTWMLEHIPYLVSDRMGLFALEARGGNCQQRVRLFALLAEQVGLRVRERAGILAGPISETGAERGSPWARCFSSERGHTPLHVWGEAWMPDSGWLPFDFLGTDNGSRRTHLRNVPETALRDHLKTWTPRLEAYSFGHIDPYRIHFAEVPRPFMGVPTGPGTEDLQALWQRAWGTRHQVELTLRGLPPEVALP